MRRFLPTTALPLALALAACDEPSPPAVANAAPVGEAPPPPPSPPGAEDTENVRQLPSTTAPAASASPPSPTPTVASEADVLRTVAFPKGDLALPVAWYPKVRNDPPMTAVHVIPAPGMTCDLAVLEGHGTPRQAEEYLAAGANAYNGDTVRAPVIEVGGHSFQGILITKPKALPDSGNAVVEVYAAISGDDLVGIGVTRLEPSPAVDEGRRSCLQAFAQLTTKLPVGATAKPTER